MITECVFGKKMKTYVNPSPNLLYRENYCDVVKEILTFVRKMLM